MEKPAEIAKQQVIASLEVIAKEQANSPEGLNNKVLILNASPGIFNKGEILTLDQYQLTVLAIGKQVGDEPVEYHFQKILGDIEINYD